MAVEVRVARTRQRYTEIRELREAMWLMAGEVAVARERHRGWRARKMMTRSRQVTTKLGRCGRGGVCGIGTKEWLPKTMLGRRRRSRGRRR
jgi:hypothetical protein